MEILLIQKFCITLHFFKSKLYTDLLTFTYIYTNKFPLTVCFLRHKNIVYAKLYEKYGININEWLDLKNIISKLLDIYFSNTRN